jgi:peptidoglycan lytic transglycosylase G
VRRQAERAPEPVFDEEPEAEAAPVRTLTSVRDRTPPPPRRMPATRRPAPRRPLPRRPAPPRARRPGSWRRRLGALIALAAIVAVGYGVVKTFQPMHGSGSGIVRISVPAGADVGEIGKLLQQRGVIADATFFEVNATVTGRRGGLHPGNYTLAHDMSYGDAIKALTKGPKAKPPLKTVPVTLPEGPSIRERAPVVDHSGKVKGSYLKAASAPSVLRQIRKLGAPKGTKTAEGFLFPATYKMVAGSTAADLVAKQLQAFKDNFSQVDMRYARHKNLTRYDVLIIASMVEREAQLDRERPLVAAVMYNRLKADMPLGIDATTRYYTNNWSRPIRVSELESDNPYNTRLRHGLPPTPIGNPGLASLQAAANPARKGYLFYVRKPGQSGEHAFSSTDAQFERDVKRYQDSRGGP